MESKMTSPTGSGEQNERNEESKTCLSDIEEMEMDCDSGVMSSVDPHPGDSEQILPLPKDTVSHKQLYWCACTKWYNMLGNFLFTLRMTSMSVKMHVEKLADEKLLTVQFEEKMCIKQE